MLLSRPRNDVENDAAVLVRRGNVEKAKFIRAFAIIDAGDLNWVTGVLEFQKFDTFNDPSGFDVEAGNDAFG
jgi:hypothetical protein